MILGAAFGPIAMIVLKEGPPGRCETCRAPVSGWRMICEWCGNDVRRPAAVAVQSLTMKAPPVDSDPATEPPLPPAPEPHLDAAPDLVPDGVHAPTVPGSEDWDLRGAHDTGHSPSVQARSSIPANPPSETEARTLASGIYVTGSVGLSVGSRYGIQLHGARLRVLGPVDRDPAIVALERPLDGTDATGYEGRLVINQTRNGKAALILVFMSITGSSTESVATEIAQAARAVEAVRA